jgi:hypothetical protein
MSYSFVVRAATKAAIRAAVSAKMADIVAAQPVHAADHEQAISAVALLLDVMTDDQLLDFSASVSGSISKSDAGVQSVSLSVNISHIARETGRPADLARDEAADHP